MRPNAKTATRRNAVRKISFNARAYAACGLLTVLLALIHFRSEVLALMPGTASLSVSAQEKKQDLLNGSILFLPADGAICRQRLIDNATWHIRDGGVVDCAAAMAKNGETWGKRMSQQRSNAIRDSFVNK